MGYLLLAIFCSAMISITMRLSSGKVGSHFSMLAANYLVCGILGAVYADFSLLATETDGIGLTVGLAVLNGAMLLGGLILLQISTRKNGVVLSSLFMKLGLLVPFVASILFFHEMPTWLQVAGFCLAIAAIVVFNVKKDGANSRFGIGLILLLLQSTQCILYVLILVLFFTGVAGLEADATEVRFLAAMIPTIVVMLIATAGSIAAAVFTYLAKYDLFRSCDPKNAVVYLAGCLIVKFAIPAFDILQPILVLLCSKKDGGMPQPQRDELPYQRDVGPYSYEE